MQFLASLGLISLGLSVLALKCLVITHLWGWFIVPVGLPHIKMWHALGIVCITMLFTYDSYSVDRQKTIDNRQRVKDLVTVLSYILVAWGIGYFAHGWAF